LRKIETEVLVIGGGAIGTGILRDLAMRGFRAILVERRDLASGTTGRFHGLLHSGGRYVVKDPEAARECIEENRILRKIMPHCIEDTGGYFVLTPEDDPGYIPQFLRGCEDAGIPVEEVLIRQMMDYEPHLNPEIRQCYQVPDAAVDSFAAAHANIASALEFSGQVLTYHEVIHLLTQDEGADNHERVIGALCHDLVNNENIEIYADLVVNAAGAWVGKIGSTANIEIAIRPGKGTMIAVSHRIVNTVINRLKMPSDGDILVPAHTVAVMGTTDEQVPDPDHFAIEPWEVQLMLAEGEKIIPGFSQLRMLRAWAGVRPLYQETKTDTSRDITRSFVLLDHEVRDGVSGLLTITSGKWTTYRKMAEVTVDQVCQKFGTHRECRTHLEELPKEDRRSYDSAQVKPKKDSSHHRSAVSQYHSLSQRLAHVEQEKAYGQLICECELATHTDIKHAITEGQAKTLDDIRRDVRLGMGPCQGAFCTFRAAGIWHSLVNRQPSTIEKTNLAIQDFLQERWKGMLPILWGQQLRQESLNELIYLNVLNIDHLPKTKMSRLGSDNYLEASRGQGIENARPQFAIRNFAPHDAHRLPSVDTIIIGAGLAGLAAAWQLADQGQKVKVIAKGWGATHWTSGCIDVLGNYPIGSGSPIDAPISAIARLTMEQPGHPYARVNLKQIDAVLKAFQALCLEAGYSLHGSLESNWLLPTSAGAFRPTSLAPETMIAGDLTDPAPMLLVGIEGFHDFYPQLTAANLKAQGISAEAVMIRLPGLQSRQRIDGMVLARYFDNPNTAFELSEAIRPYLGSVERIGLPAVLGTHQALSFVRALESQLGCRVFEIPGLPPSIPGMRLHQILVEAIQKSGGQVFSGMEVIGSQRSATGNQINAVFSEAAARNTLHLAQNYILATGGILGGGIYTDHTGRVSDPIFNLPIQAAPEMSTWFAREFLHPDGHPIFRTGISSDEKLKTEFDNLFVIGNALAGDFIRERSLEGVALVSAFQIGEILA